MSFREDQYQEEDEQELELVCPLYGREARVRVRSLDGEVERLEVVRCSLFEDEEMTCGQPCMRELAALARS